MKCKTRASICIFVFILSLAFFISLVLHSKQDILDEERKHSKRKSKYRVKKARKPQKAVLREKRLVRESIKATTLPKSYNLHSRGILPGQIIKSDDEASGLFREIAKDTYVYSAFYDDTRKQPCVHLILISGQHYQPTLLCQFCEIYSPSCTFQNSQARYYTPNENHGRAFGGFIASCDLPAEFNGIPLYVDITADVKGTKTTKLRVPVVSNVKLKENPYPYTICVPPLREDKLDRNKLVEFIELSKLLGASHFTFYDFKIGDKLKQVLELYKTSGTVDILPWNLPSPLVSRSYDIWYYGQVIAILDCLYRYKHRAKFVSFNDVDEFIVPLRNATSMPKLLKLIHKPSHCGHCFQSVVFSLNARLPRQKNKLFSQKFFHRTKDTIPLLSKCIVDPLRVFEMGIHHISKATGQRYSVDLVHESISLIFHYRICTASFGIRHQCIELRHDGAMAKFGKKLLRNFDKIIHEIEQQNVVVKT